MAPVRFGLVGYGFGGRCFHAPLLGAAAECEFIGRGHLSPERRALVAQEHPGRRDLRLARGAAGGRRRGGGDLHARPTRTATLTDQALELGLAVVCDKPFALDAAAARGTVELAERLGLPLSPYQNRRWDSDFLTVRAPRRRRRAGRGARFESRFERLAPEPGPARLGGGTLLRLRQPPGRPGAGAPRPGGLGLRRVAAARRAAWTTTSSWPSRTPAVPARTCGAAGARARPARGSGSPERRAATSTARSWTARRTCCSPGTRRRRWARSGASSRAERWGRLHRGDDGEPVPTRARRWDTFYPAFARAVRGLGPVPVDPRDAVATATVLDAARRSATAGEVVPLEP